MPTYTYKCKNCGHKTTKLVSVDKRDKPDFKCPSCNKKTLKRAIDKPAGFKMEQGGTINKTRNSKTKHDHDTCASGTCNI